jgi:hypothetical protein
VTLNPNPSTLHPPPSTPDPYPEPRNPDCEPRSPYSEPRNPDPEPPDAPTLVTAVLEEGQGPGSANVLFIGSANGSKSGKAASGAAGDACADLRRLIANARADGRGGDMLVAAGLVRACARLCSTLRRAWQVEADAAAVGADDKSSTCLQEVFSEAHVRALEERAAAARERLETKEVLHVFAASAALVAEAEAMYAQGILAVTQLLRELDVDATLGAPAGPEGTEVGVGGARGKTAMQMMPPKVWARGREALSKAVGRAAPVLYSEVPRVLIVAGSDCSGGAGIQADLKACQAAGAFAMTAITALTAQNTTGVSGVMGVPVAFVEDQILACLTDIRADVVKTGMLASAEVVEAVARAVGRRGAVKWVIDPVMVATSGDRLVAPAAVSAMVDKLFPVAHIITPNLPETALLLESEPITSVEQQVLGP